MGAVEHRMLVFAGLIFTLTLAPALAQTAQTAQNVADLQAVVSNLVNQVAAAQNQLNITARTVVPTATVADMTGNQQVVVDYVISSGTQCGKRTITGWTENVDFYFKVDANTAAADTNKQFSSSTGIFTTPVAGYYKVCASARFRTPATQWTCASGRLPPI